MKHKFIALLVVGALALTTLSSVLANVSFNGNITSGAQYDLYTVELSEGDQVTATLVCDFDGVSRPLDPILSVFYPDRDSSDTLYANVYDDDGFGLDDDPNGVDCDGFDSSRVMFEAPVAGIYTFRADGFGSSTGLYTLSITIIPSNAFVDGRINPQPGAPLVLYCNGTTTEVYSVTGTHAGSVENGATVTIGGASFRPTPEGRMEVTVGQPDGKTYLYQWDGCDSGRYEAYTVDGAGVPTLFDQGAY